MKENAVLTYLLDLATQLPVLLPVWFFIDCSLTAKRPFRQSFFRFFSAVGASVCAVTLFTTGVLPIRQELLPLLALLEFSVFLLMTRLLTTDPFRKVLLIFGMSIVLLGFGNAAAQATWHVLLLTPAFREASAFAYDYPIYTLLALLYQTVLLFFGGRVIKRYFLHHPIQIQWDAFGVTLFSEALVLLTLTYLLAYVDVSASSIIVLCVLLGAMLAADIMLSRAFRSMMKNAEMERQLRLHEQAESLQQAQYLAVSKQIYETRRLRHDYRNTLQTLSLLLQGGQVDAARALIDQTDQNISAGEAPRTGNAIIDAVLQLKRLEATQAGIAFSLSLLLPERLPVRESDLMSVFTNLLDNAIAYCETLPPETNRKIEVRSALSGRILKLTFANTFLGDALPDPARPVSTKAEKENHGYGLAIVRSIAESCGGSLSVAREGDMIALHMLLSLDAEVAALPGITAVHEEFTPGKAKNKVDFIFRLAYNSIKGKIC